MSESKKLYVLNVVVSLISPVRLAGEDRIKDILGIDKIPATMRALLAQEVIDRKILNPLAAIKKRVRETLLKYGTREPLLGWVVDPDRVSDLTTDLQRHQADFEQAKQDLMACYAQSCAQHIEALRQACLEEGMAQIEVFLDVIRGSQPTEGYLRSQLQYRYLEPRAIELHEQEFEIVQEGLFGQAIADIARRAEEAQKALRASTRVKALDEIEAKLRGLAYLDGRFGAIARQVDRLVGELPVNLPNNEWDTRSEWALTGALEQLADRQRLIRRIEQEEVLFDMQVDTVDPVLPTPDPAATPVVELCPETKPAPATPLSKPAVPEPVSSSDVYVVDTAAW